MSTTTKPQSEINVLFSKDPNGCVVVLFYEAHGSFAWDAHVAGLPAKASGKDAIRLTGKVGSLVKELGLQRKPFVANGHTYYSYRSA
jgi:hypothetical protein